MITVENFGCIVLQTLRLQLIKQATRVPICPRDRRAVFSTVVLLIGQVGWLPREAPVNIVADVHRGIAVVLRRDVTRCRICLLERQLLVEEALRHNPGDVGLMQAVTGTKRQEPT